MNFAAMKRCPGCAVRRSITQFVTGSEYCALCRKNNVTQPISTRRHPIR